MEPSIQSTPSYPDAQSAFQERLAPQLEEARRNLAEVNQRVTTFVRANPGLCLIGACAVGFLVGKIASRR